MLWSSCAYYIVQRAGCLLAKKCNYLQNFICIYLAKYFLYNLYSAKEQETDWLIDWLTDELNNYLMNSMEQSYSWEANRSSASQEIPCILWNLEVHYHNQKSPSPVPIPSHIKAVHVPQPTIQRFILTLSSHLCLGLSSGLFPSGLPTKTKKQETFITDTATIYRTSPTIK
jgi:hypothetical protein